MVTIFCFSLMVSFVFFFLIFKYDSWNTLDNDTWYFVNYKNRFVIPLLTNPWDVERDNTEAVLFFKNVDVFLKVFLTNFFFFLSVGGNFLRVTLVFSVVFELPVVSTPFNSGRVVPLGVEQAQNLKERLERLIEKKLSWT